MSKTKTIFITGTSTGLGKLAALHFARQGWQVAATMRTPRQETELTQYPNVTLLPLDVTSVASVQAATSQAVTALGRIDVVLNNAGVGVYGPLELVPETAIDDQLAVNVRGVINVIRAFLPHFRTQGGGMFINVGSVMGLSTGLPLSSLYNMSKFALEGLIEGLYYELKPLNIEVRMVEPGGFASGFKQNLVFSHQGAATGYETLTAKVGPLLRASPADAPAQPIVDAIFDLATSTSTKFRTVVGDDAQGLVGLRASLPIEDFLATAASRFS